MPTRKAALTENDFLVLVLDEDQDLCRTVSKALIEVGCRVQCLPLNQQSWQTVRDLAPDLVILDISTPDAPRLEMLRRITASRGVRKTPVIVTSWQPELEYELLDVFDFLVKPISLRRLLDNIRLLREGGRLRTATPYPPLSDAEMHLFQEYLIGHSGLHFDHRNQKILERGLMHRMRALASPDYRSYFQYLETYAESRQELKKLLGLLTIGETFFFRYHAHFEALIERVIPDLIHRNRHSRTLRIWSAGCSTGEEAYSLGILLLDRFPQLVDWQVTILATDINKRSLRLAREAIYRGRALRLTEQRLLDNYFTMVPGGLLVGERVRKLVHFAYLNLQTGLYPALENGTDQLDIIFCRNVMIYFRLATIRSVVERFTRCLRPGGYLFLGHAETLMSVSEAFLRQQHAGGFYYRLKEASTALPVHARRAEDRALPTPEAAPPPVAPSPLATVARAVTAPSLVTPPPAPAAKRDLAALLKEAELEFNRENFKTASQNYDMILDEDENHVAALVGKGFIRANEGAYDEAMQLCRRIVQIDDLCPQAYFLRGLIHDLAGETEHAIGEYRKALLLDIAFIMPRYNLSKLFWRLGRLPEARRELKNTARMLEKSPDEALVPYAGGLTRAVFLELCREDAARFEGLDSSS